MGVIERARQLRNLIKEYAEKAEDKTLVIATSEYFEEWKPGKYKVGDIRLNKKGLPRESMIDHDSTVNINWTIDERTVWKPYHSRKKEYALLWEQPSAEYDMYKSGEYMVFTDGYTYFCKISTNFSPIEYPQAWEVIT